MARKQRQGISSARVERTDAATVGYRLFEHTADTGLTAWGPSPAEAFAAAALGMFAIMLGADPVRWRGAGRAGTLELTVEGGDWPDLLVNWLSELLYHFEVEGFVPRTFAISACAPPRCAARMTGCYLTDPGRLRGTGVKAVTYHQLACNIAPGRTDLRVIFDI